MSSAFRALPSFFSVVDKGVGHFGAGILFEHDTQNTATASNPQNDDLPVPLQQFYGVVELQVPVGVKAAFDFLHPQTLTVFAENSIRNLMRAAICFTAICGSRLRRENFGRGSFAGSISGSISVVAVSGSIIFRLCLVGVRQGQ
jgi:hypothetical protein